MQQQLKYQQTALRDKEMVFIHGAFGDTGIIDVLEEQFGKDYRITVPYLPGHGSFDIPNNFKYQNMAETLEDFLNELGFRNYVLVGHSLGGRLILDINSKAKQQILFAPILSPILANQFSTGIRVVADYLSDLGTSHRRNLQIDTIIDRLKNSRQIWRIVKGVKEIEFIDTKIPTTIIWGEDDTVLPYIQNKDFIPRLKNVNLQTYPGGHYWPFKKSSMEIVKKLLWL